MVIEESCKNLIVDGYNNGMWNTKEKAIQLAVGFYKNNYISLDTLDEIKNEIQKIDLEKEAVFELQENDSFIIQN